jgi:hypothetical protein
MANYQGVTLIQNLPELNDYKLPPAGYGPKFDRPTAGADPGAYGKYINNTGHNRPGMADYAGMRDGPHHSLKNFDGYTGSGAEMSGPGGYLQIPSAEMYSKPPPNTVTEHYDFEESESGNTSADADVKKECSCRDVYDHVNGCNICKAFYMEGRSNFIYLLIITIMTIIIAVLGHKCYTIKSR